jgi:Bifunctional DNA primase/polymerase, N-terminal
MSKALEHALALARRGVAVFPCKNAQGSIEHKAPLTSRGFKDASTDREMIERWWGRCPDALIGAVAWMFCAVDIDLQHAEAQEWLKQNQNWFPATRTHRTQRGGLHLVFRPHAEVGCTVGTIAPHVDTRGQGKGYIIWWPAHGFEVTHRAIVAAVPDWIVTRLRSPEPPRSSARLYDGHSGSARGKINGIVRAIVRAREGERNCLTFWAACRLAELAADGFIGRDAAIDLAVAAAAYTGLPENEAKRTVLSAFRQVRQ